MVDIPPGIRTRIAVIARTYPGVQYDMHDPNAAAIEECARQMGIVAIPADGVAPRSLNGAIPPPPPIADLLTAPLNPDDPAEVEAAVKAVATAIHTAVCSRFPHLPTETHTPFGDEVIAGAFIHTLLDTGWTLARYMPPETSG